MTVEQSLVDLQVRDDGVATLTLDDAARRNAVSRQMSLDVEAACERIEADSRVKVVVVTGVGSVFSAGGDVDALANPDFDLAPLYRGFRAVHLLSVPTIAAINGPAIGAGANFALACDVRVAARSAKFDATFLDIAIHPGGGYLWRMNNAIGKQATSAVVLMGEKLTAERALDLGLVWSVVDDADLMGEANRLATRVAARSPEVVRRTKASLRASIPLHDERLAIDLEEIGQLWSMGRPAYREATAKLLARLRPSSDR
ncbi:enoyl-CoA hydratase-related protein [Microbacterium sp. A588]